MSALTYAANDEDGETINALRAAVQQACDWISEEPGRRPISAGRLLAILTNALAAAPQPPTTEQSSVVQQQAMAWVWFDKNRKPCNVTFGGPNINTPKDWVVLPLYTHQQPPTTVDSSVVQLQGKQQPVAEVIESHVRAGLDGRFTAEVAGRERLSVGAELFVHPQNLRCKSNQARLATLWGYVKEQPPRRPLTDQQINDHRLALAYDSEDLPDPWDFKQGVRAAERAHGITGETK